MMKQLIAIILMVGWGKLATAQTLHTYADTANYLVNEIAAKKYTYIGNPFSVLFDSLRIKPTQIINVNTEKKNFGEKLSFEFNNKREFSKSHFIVVSFISVPAYNTLFPILYPGVGVDRDNNLVINTYKPLIIKDIIMKDYTNDDDPDPTIGVKKPVKN